MISHQGFPSAILALTPQEDNMRKARGYGKVGHGMAHHRASPARYSGTRQNAYFLVLPSIAFSMISLGRDAAFNKAFRAVAPASPPILSAA